MLYGMAPIARKQILKNSTIYVRGRGFFDFQRKNIRMADSLLDDRSFIVVNS